MAASTDVTTEPIAYRIATHVCANGMTLYSAMLVYADGSEMSVGRMLKSAKGVRNQKGITLDGLTEVAA